MNDLPNPVMDNLGNQGTIETPQAPIQPQADQTPIPPPVTSWLDGLPQELKEAKTLQKFKSTEDAVKAYVNLEKTLGNKRLAIPTKESTPEEWESVYNELGRPKTPNDYELPKIENAPEGLFDQNRVNGFRDIAHKAGLNNSQFNALVSSYMEGEVNTYNRYQKALEEQKQEGIAKLRAEQGANYDKYMLDYQRIIDTFGNKSPEFIEEAKSSGLINNPAFIKFVGGISEQLTSSTLTNTSNKIVTQKEALDEITKMDSDMNNPLYIKEHPQHKNAVERRQYLTEIAYR